MMKHCLYCAQTNTKLDIYGYCIRYDCFARSGKRDTLYGLIQKASTLYFISNSGGQVGRVITNHYSPRTRKANDIMNDARVEFGFVPFELLQRIPLENREKWDKGIRW